MFSQLLSSLIVLICTFGCQESNNLPVDKVEFAVVNSVTVSGSENNYNFAVSLTSPDTGCGQYANWWEVISAGGKTLIYRRILGHSHVNEQPFTRSGGPVAVAADTELIIRAHMHPSGYGSGIIVMKGTVAKGFLPFDVSVDFGSDLEKASPQPTGCAF